MRMMTGLMLAMAAMTARAADWEALGPASASAGVVMVHDWFGVTPFYRHCAERLATAGYRVHLVDLYQGASAETHQQAWDLMQALDAEEAARIIDRAAESMGARADGIALMGFSMGAPHALGAALRHGDRVRATVVYYGDTINDPERLKKLSGPVLSIYGSRDGDAADNAASFSKAADAAGAAAEIYIYPGAHHAFAQPLFNAGKTYDPVAAEAAWRLTEEFLARSLGN